MLFQLPKKSSSENNIISSTQKRDSDAFSSEASDLKMLSAITVRLPAMEDLPFYEQLRIQTKKKVIATIVQLYFTLKIPLACSFFAVQILEKEAMADLILEAGQSAQGGIDVLALALLLLSYKQLETGNIKYTLSQIGIMLGLPSKTVQLVSVIEKQGQVLSVCNFDIIVESPYAVMTQLLDNWTTVNPKTVCLAEYFIDLSMANNYKRLFGSKRGNQAINVILAAIKLSCYFQNDTNWNNDIPASYRVEMQTVDKYCQRLFPLLLKAKQSFPYAYEKYCGVKYHKVSQIKLVHVSKLHSYRNDSHQEQNKQKNMQSRVASEGIPA